MKASQADTYSPEDFTSNQVKPIEPEGGDFLNDGSVCEAARHQSAPGEVGLFPLDEAKRKAEEILELIRPHCYRAEIAGSIRRKKNKVKDIEIVCIPKPFQTGLFENGIASIINQYKKIKGELIYGQCKYTQRIIPMQNEREIKLDLFMTSDPEKWGLLLAIRTGSADFSKKLASRWVELGYHSRDGILIYAGKPHPCYEEIDVFKRLGIPWTEPENRI